MKKCSQRALARELGLQHSYINKLCKKKDHRIVMIGNNIDRDATIDRFFQYGYGEVSEKRKKQKKIKEALNVQPKQKIESDNIQNEISANELPELDVKSGRMNLERIKIYEQVRKLRIENEVKEGNLVNKKEMENIFFEIARQARDMLEAIPENVSPLLVSQDQHSIEQVLTAHLKKVLESLSVKIIRRSNDKA
jgi:phage terminase Nu1 subunit (DNA packaging protein)